MRVVTAGDSSPSSGPTTGWRWRKAQQLRDLFRFCNAPIATSQGAYRYSRRQVKAEGEEHGCHVSSQTVPPLPLVCLPPAASVDTLDPGVASPTGLALSSSASNAKGWRLEWGPLQAILFGISEHPLPGFLDFFSCARAHACRPNGAGRSNEAQQPGRGQFQRRRGSRCRVSMICTPMAAQTAFSVGDRRWLGR